MPIYFQEISKDGKKLFVKLKDFGALKISYILALSLRGPPVGFTNCDLRICVVRMDGWVVIRRVLPFWSVFCIITRVLRIICFHVTRCDYFAVRLFWFAWFAYTRESCESMIRVTCINANHASHMTRVTRMTIRMARINVNESCESCESYDSHDSQWCESCELYDSHIFANIFIRMRIIWFADLC